jgi:hypothetical protein
MVTVGGLCLILIVKVETDFTQTKYLCQVEFHVSLSLSKAVINQVSTGLSADKAGST